MLPASGMREPSRITARAPWWAIRISASDLRLDQYMNRIPRRSFLKHAAAAGCLSGRLAAASGKIAIVTGAPGGISSSEPVRWAAGELRRAVEEKGDSCVIVSSLGEAGDFRRPRIPGSVRRRRYRS